MNENVLQAEVERLIAAGSLVAAIKGRERPQQVLDGLNNPSFVPQFPVDYLIRQRSAAAAAHVLDVMDGLTAVSTASRSISLTVGEIMKADVLGCNKAKAALGVLELKVDDGPGRQAVTELLAYDQEVRNHLPFLSNDQLCFVVVSNGFSTLLDHSIASLITWQRRNILCLNAQEVDGKLEFSLHLPSCWAAVGQDVLPAGSLQTRLLSIRPREGAEEIAETAAMSALQRVVRMGERLGSHGFVMLIRDQLYPAGSNAPLHLLIGLLNPYAFLAAANDSGLGGNRDTPLAQYLCQANHAEDLGTTEAPFQRVCESAIHSLQPYCECTWGPATTWDQERAPITRFTGTYRLPLRADLPHCDAWGAVGEYLQDMTLHPAILQHEFPEFDKPGLDWTFPPFAILLLDGMAAENIFAQGQITASGMFHLGMRFGRMLCAYQTCLSITDGDFKNLPTLVQWCQLDLLDGLREVRYRFSASADIKLPTESLRLRPVEGANVSIKSLLAEIEWITDHFIRETYPVHQQMFRLGLNAHVLFDDYFGTGASAQQVRELHFSMVEASKGLLLSTIDWLFDTGPDPARQTNGRLLLKDEYGITVGDDAAAARDAVTALPNAVHVDHFVQGLLPLLDLWLPLVFHRLRPIGAAGIDWSWLEQQIVGMRAAGFKFPGLTLWPSGELTTTPFDKIAKELPLPKINDPKTQVLVCRDEGVPVYTVMTWEQLRTGALQQDFMKDSEAPRTEAPKTGPQLDP